MEGNTYSRIVAALKVILPLIALGLLSSVFLVATPPEQGEPVPFPDLTISQLAREQRLGAPAFSGVTDDGTRVTVAASRLWPDPEQDDVILGSDLAARLSTPDGVEYRISAPVAEIDRAGEVTTLTDNVRVESSNGYRMRMQAAEITGDFSRLSSLSPVTVFGPLGRIEAGQMAITQDPDTGTQTRILFTEGVRLVYRPDIEQGLP